MLKIEDVHFQQRLDRLNFRTVLDARLNFRSRWIIDECVLHSLDREEYMQELHRLALREFWQRLYGDLRRPFYDLERMAARSEYTNYHELKEVTEHLHRLLTFP